MGKRKIIKILVAAIMAFVLIFAVACDNGNGGNGQTQQFTVTFNTLGGSLQHDLQ